MLMYKLLNFIQHVCLKNFLKKKKKKTILNNTWHKIKSRNFSTSTNLLAKSINQVI